MAAATIGSPSSSPLQVTVSNPLQNARLQWSGEADENARTYELAAAEDRKRPALHTGKRLHPPILQQHVLAEGNRLSRKRKRFAMGVIPRDAGPVRRCNYSIFDQVPRQAGFDLPDPRRRRGVPFH